MSTVHLSGRLICADAEQASAVELHLPEHARLSRAEPGCLRFEVTGAKDPLVWDVSESFVDRAAFDAHQARVSASPWGVATAGIRRDYTVIEDRAQCAQSPVLNSKTQPSTPTIAMPVPMSSTHSPTARPRNATAVPTPNTSGHHEAGANEP